MVQQRTVRQVVDNTGVRKVRSIMVVPESGVVGSVVLGVVTQYRKGSKWSRGMRVYGVRVSRAKEKARGSGQYARVGSSGMVLVNGKQEVLGTRVRGVRQLERRSEGRAQLRSMGQHRV